MFRTITLITSQRQTTSMTSCFPNSEHNRNAINQNNGEIIKIHTIRQTFIPRATTSLAAPLQGNAKKLH